jgi:hypothetical protein
VRIKNGLHEPYRPPELEDAIRAALAAESGDLEVVITHAADAWHAEIVVLEQGRRRAAYFADLNRDLGELSSGLRRALAPVVEPAP